MSQKKVLMRRLVNIWSNRMGNTMEKIRYGKKRRLIHVTGKERMKNKPFNVSIRFNYS